MGNQAIREALEFYRDEWETPVDADRTATGWSGDIGDPEPSADLLADRGDRAHYALTALTEAGRAGVGDGWQELDTAPFDKWVLIDCDRWDAVCAAIRYRHGGWTTFGANGPFDCQPTAWRPMPDRRALAAALTPPAPATPAPDVERMSNDVLEEAARVAEGTGRPIGGGDGDTYTVGTATQAAAGIRVLKDASLPDYSGGGS